MATQTQTRRKIKLKKPAKYCNVFFNNDLTTFDAVIHIFSCVFKYSFEEALKKANEINETGKSIVFINSQEACNLKREMVEQEKSRLQEAHNIHLLEHKVELYEEDEE